MTGALRLATLVELFVNGLPICCDEVCAAIRPLRIEDLVAEQLVELQDAYVRARR